MWRYLLRPLLFRMDPEWVHYFSMNSFSLGLSVPGVRSLVERLACVEEPCLNVDVLGLVFKNPVGLAAGFDKDARWYDQLSALGFSHIEVGTLTGQPQAGNPKKRLFRLPKDQALLNCLGFNNRGSQVAMESMRSSHLSEATRKSVLGINIGLSKSVAMRLVEEIDPGETSKVQGQTPNPERMEWAIDDYLLSFRRMHPFADYFTINVSSPNTQGLRDLQHPAKIGRLISAIRAENEKLGQGLEGRKPVLVKLAPDLSEKELDETLEALVAERVDGLIATNTTLSDAGLKTSATVISSKRCQCPNPGGGFSGGPLTLKSREFVAKVFKKTDGKLPIVGVGGILSGEDSWEMIAAGASLVQVYTGFIYGGPFFIGKVNRYLANRLQEEKMHSISELVGTRC
ncbi:MAG: quinone-dependent dihydroorotate dehydrogenase [Planctomycetota bacterium]|nr:quinone-dependent dihydroorotate dehydrogenase [Planctomycetota bacterium]